MQGIQRPSPKPVSEHSEAWLATTQGATQPETYMGPSVMCVSPFFHVSARRCEAKQAPPTDGERPLFERHCVLIAKQLQQSRLLGMEVMNLYPALFHPKWVELRVAFLGATMSQTFRQQGGT